MDFSVGDIVQMKKSHPCGSAQWEILRTGIDFRIKCCGCGHMVMLPRAKFEKNVKKNHPKRAIKTGYLNLEIPCFFLSNPLSFGLILFPHCIQNCQYANADIRKYRHPHRRNAGNGKQQHQNLKAQCKGHVLVYNPSCASCNLHADC